MQGIRDFMKDISGFSVKRDEACAKAVDAEFGYVMRQLEACMKGYSQPWRLQSLWSRETHEVVCSRSVFRVRRPWTDARNDAYEQAYRELDELGLRSYVEHQHKAKTISLECRLPNNN